MIKSYSRDMEVELYHAHEKAIAKAAMSLKTLRVGSFRVRMPPGTAISDWVPPRP